MIAYFDCFSGISGDMTLAALLDLGVSADWLKKTITESLDLSFGLSVSSVQRSGIAAKRVDVSAAGEQPHRHYADIRQMIENSGLAAAVQEMSVEMFDRLAAAEAKIHGCAKEEVHFHEVGAADAFVDIVGTALCVDHLAIREVRASKIPMSRGKVTCTHGTLPVPAPATLEILKDVPVCNADVEGELVTPTGAAIIRTLSSGYGVFPDMRIAAVGYGAGAREFKDLPNLLRIVTGSPESAKERLYLVETSIDDMNPEFYGHLLERLLSDGALDVCMIPSYMKKNRPGTLLQVLSPLSLKEQIVERILSETTTLGVRYYEVERKSLAREPVAVKTPYGSISAKKVILPDGRCRIVPEYDACRAASEEWGLCLRDVYDLVSRDMGSCEP